MDAATVEERLAKIETTLGYIHETWETHNENHEKLDANVQTLLLDQARNEGERSANRRLAGFVALAVSVVVSLLSIAYTHFF